MTNIQVGGRDIKGISVWDGTRHRKVVGKIMTSEGLKDFYRPINFRTDFVSTDSMSILNGKTRLTQDVSRGTTFLPLKQSGVFYVGQIITITDGTVMEDLMVVSVTFEGVYTSPTAHSYAVNSLVARTTTEVIDGALLFPSLVSYGIRDINALFSLDMMEFVGEHAVVDAVQGLAGELLNFDSSSGWSSEGLYFDGIDDHIDFGNHITMGLDSLVISVIVKTSSTGIQNILSKFSTGFPEGYAVRITNGYPRMIIRDASGVAINFQGTVFVADGEWHHIEYVFDRHKNASIYVDGVLDSEVDISSYADRDITSPITLKIGAMEQASSGTTNLFEGTIKSVYVTKLP